jgi:DNA-directed RNA polymerase II subunit RPB2
LANDFQRLCLHAGWSANKKLKEKAGAVRKINGKMIKTNADAWRLTIITKQNNPKVNKTKEMDKYIKYKGIVYCCTVPNGVVYVRRDGMVAWCGNSRSGQKGTVGYKPHRSDMPFSLTGLVPDIIVNPNAFPKRMTIGQLIECLMGKVCAVKGVYGDATAFTKIDIHKINDELVALGMIEWGFETMYNGITGKRMANPIFIGPTYYQRLKQMVSDKVHARARGLMQMMTRQPTEGRSRDGGLRLGEMERDAICAHGCAQFLKEKLVDNSDIYRIQVCDICGMFASKVINEDNYTCKACQNNVNISTIVIPYAFKLLIQELKSIQILARIITSKSITIPRG